MIEQLELLAQWLNTEIEKNETYHNHKETMAWGATALWLTSAGYLFVRMPPLTGPGQIALTVCYVMLAFFTLRFVNMQLTMRWYSADRTVALRRAVVELCHEMYPGGRGETLPMLRIGMVDTEFPAFVSLRLIPERNGVVRIARKCRGYWPGKGETGDYRWRSEIATYLAIVLGLIAVIVRIWIQIEQIPCPPMH